MTPDRIFSLAGALVLPCWLLLLVAPGWRWTHRLASFFVPLLLAGVYLFLLLSHPTPAGGGFNSLGAVARLFGSPYALLAGWLHYLAFDLFIGAWETRDALRLGLSRWWLLACLPLTFLLGPAGLALYLILRGIRRREVALAMETA